MKKTIVFTGGGTLGHVMPNIYLINDLKNDYNCTYIGSLGIEKEKLTPLLKEQFYTIPAVKLIRGKIIANLKIPFVLIDAIFKAKKALKLIKPSLVFSKGGYVALPVCIAAKMLKIPIIAHESDYSFGLANKIILKLCNTMCVNFKHLESKNKKITYTGAILDKNFDSPLINPHPFNLKSGLPTILIVGGSLGAKAINELLIKIINKLLPLFNVIHITGKGNITLKSYQNYNAVEMYNDMPSLYNLASFVIGRSGAGVTAECFYKLKPMLLIPLENSSSRGDQNQNANYYKSKGVANILHEKDLTPNLFYNEITDFYKNINKYKTAYQKQTIVNGRQKTEELIEKILKSNTKK